MSIPWEMIAEQLRVTSQIKTLTARDLIKLWDVLDIEDMTRSWAVLEEALRDITATYGDISAASAIDFLESAAEAAGRPSAVIPMAAVAPDEQVGSMMRWGLGPLWEETPRPSMALKRLAGGAGRLSLQPGRNTVLDYVRRERIRWAFVPQGTATCPFCLMLASRGAVYHTEQPRYHEFCDCSITPIHEDQDVPQVNQDLEDEWRAVTAGARDQRAVWGKHIRETRGLES